MSINRGSIGRLILRERKAGWCDLFLGCGPGSYLNFFSQNIWIFFLKLSYLKINLHLESIRFSWMRVPFFRVSSSWPWQTQLQLGIIDSCYPACLIISNQEDPCTDQSSWSNEKGLPSYLKCWSCYISGAWIFGNFEATIHKRQLVQLKGQFTRE